MSRINAVTFHDDPSIESICRIVLDSGFDGIEVSRPPFFQKLRTPELRRRFKVWMRQIGLSMYGFDCWVDVLPFDRYDETIEAFSQAIAWASELDLKMIISHDPWLKDNGGRTPAQCLGRNIELFQQIGRMCREKNLSLVLEPHPDTLSMDDAWAIDLIDGIGMDHVGLVYDCCHYGVGQPRTYLRAIQRLGRRIRHIHLSDGDLKTYALHLPAGDGRIDLPTVSAALKELGFRGSLTFDLYSYPLPEDGASRSADRVREFEQQLEVRP